MRKRLARGSVINTTKNFITSELENNNIKAIKRNSLKYDQKNQGDVLLQIKAKLKQSYLKMVKNFEKKAGNIIMQHKNNYSNQVQNNYFKMFVTNITSEKSHRIRLKYTERILEVDPKEILINYYKKHDCYSRLRIMIKAYDDNIIFFPNYFVNESVYSLMSKYLEQKEKFLKRVERDYKNNKLSLPKPKYKIMDNYKEISNKIIESFIDDNSLNLENKLKNLNDDSSSKSSINKSNSSLNVKKLIKRLGDNLEKKKEYKVRLNKKKIKLKTKKFALKNFKINDTGNDNVKNNNDNNEIVIKRMYSETKPISFTQNKIIQKIYLDDFLYKKFNFSKSGIKINDQKMKKNNIADSNIYSKTFNNIYSNNNPININSYKDKNIMKDSGIIHNFKSTNLFLYNYFKEKNLEKSKKIKKTIINSIKEYETLQNLRTISFLNSKKKTLVKKFTLSSSKKKLIKNYVKNDGFTTEITQLKDILNRQKLKEERAFKIQGKTDKDYLLSVILFFNRNNSHYINSASMTARIGLNIRNLLKNKKYEFLSLINDNK